MEEYGNFVEMNEDGHAIVKNDCIAQFKGHTDSIFMVACRPVAPFDTYASGDGADKAYVWQVRPKPEVEEKEGEAE
jgi:hypothetical protein